MADPAGNVPAFLYNIGLDGRNDFILTLAKCMTGEIVM